MAIHRLDPSTASALGLKAALVTGASSGIGWHLALQLAEAGVPVIALGRDESRLARLVPLAGRHASIAVCRADLADVQALPALAARLLSQRPDLNCIIHNAAVQHDLRLDDDGYGLPAIVNEIDTNLSAPIALTQALLPVLQSRHKAWVVHVSSGLAYAPKGTSAVYAATKAALHLFGAAMRLQLRGGPVRVMEAVMPLVDTPMTHGRGRRKWAPEEAAAALLNGLHREPGVFHIGPARALPLLQRLTPGLLARLMSAG